MLSRIWSRVFHGPSPVPSLSPVLAVALGTRTSAALFTRTTPPAAFSSSFQGWWFNSNSSSSRALLPLYTNEYNIARPNERAILQPLVSLGGMSLASYNAVMADGAEQLEFLQTLLPMRPSVMKDLRNALDRVDELETLSNDLIVFIERQKDEIRRLQSQ